MIGLCCACGQPNNHAMELSQIDTLMQSQPDSALHYLELLDTTAFSKSERVYYGLLVTQATDKASLPLFPCDSLVCNALNYYSKGSGENRAKALYYKGRILDQQNLPDKARAYYSQALTELTTSNAESIKLKASIHAAYTKHFESYKYDKGFVGLSVKGINHLLSEKKKHAFEYSNLADLAKANGNFKDAFSYEEKYAQVLDSIYSLNRISEIEHLVYKYQTDTKSIQKKNQAKMINLFILLCVIFIAIFLVQYLVRRQKSARLMYEHMMKQLRDDITMLQLRIKIGEKDVLELQQMHVRNEEEIKQKEEDLHRMIEEKARLCNVLFMKTSIFRKIEKLSKQDRKEKKNIQVLITAEQEQLAKTIFEIYADYIDQLRSSYPKLTDEDCIYCCLCLCNLDDSTIAYCFGNTNKQIVAQRRLRLKSKMAEEIPDI